MGDVALILPAISGITDPDVEIVVLTRPAFSPFFTETGMLTLFLTDFNGRHKGFAGILRLFNDLRKTGKFDRVIDLHNVIRSRIIGLLLRFTGATVTVIDKGRREKRQLIKGHEKKPLKHTVERYVETINKAGYATSVTNGPWIHPPENALEKLTALFGNEKAINIGVAPLAKHPLKMWPEGHMEKLLKLISENHNAKFWFFGGREDKTQLEAMALKAGKAYCFAGKYPLDVELAAISKLDFMIAMDSSNMHMAALVSTKTVSIWGATDPLAGFGAWRQPESYSIMIPVEKLPCRPCTVYGKGTCLRGDFACMETLTPETVYGRIVKSGLL
jgi:ADP-heptose:LPS heptosyltransferase